MALFQAYRGAESNIPAEKTDGYIYFCTDSGNIYIDCLNESGELSRIPMSANYSNVPTWPESTNPSTQNDYWHVVWEREGALPEGFFLILIE